MLTRFYGFAGGKPTALMFAHAGATEQERTRFASQMARAIESGVEVVLVQRDPHVVETPAGVRLVFIDRAGTVALLYGAARDATSIFFVDPNLCVVDRVDDGRGFEEGLTRAVDSRLTQEPLEIGVQAPVLLIPNVLDDAECKDLIARFDREGGVETGVERSLDGTRAEVFDAGAKRRRDMVVTDAALIRSLTTTIGRRLIPQVEKAFVFRATAFEGFKIAAYHAADGGHFRPHRDNLSPATSHRRFALTLNLNDDYENGHIRFLEYSPHLYRPGAGCAVVFSCSLLHEATRVTRGSRFVLLSFLLDAAGTESRSRAKLGRG